MHERVKVILSPSEQSGTSVHSSSLPIPHAGDLPFRGQPQATARWSVAGTLPVPISQKGKARLKEGLGPPTGWKQDWWKGSGPPSHGLEWGPQGGPRPCPNSGS